MRSSNEYISCYKISDCSHCLLSMKTDDKNPAESILHGQSGRWLTNSKDTSGRLEGVFQMLQAINIGFIDIGNCGSATVEIWVARGNNYNFECLLPATVFMNPMESRTGKNAFCVRMFNKDNFNKDVCASKYDRIKVICTQPYNKQQQFGISFLTIGSEKDEELLKMQEYHSTVEKETEKSLSTMDRLHYERENTHSVSAQKIVQQSYEVNGDKDFESSQEGESENPMFSAEILSFLDSLNLHLEKDLASIKVSTLRKQLEEIQNTTFTKVQRQTFLRIAQTYTADLVKRTLRQRNLEHSPELARSENITTPKSNKLNANSHKTPVSKTKNGSFSLEIRAKNESTPLSVMQNKTPVRTKALSSIFNTSPPESDTAKSASGLSRISEARKRLRTSEPLCDDDVGSSTARNSVALQDTGLGSRKGIADTTPTPNKVKRTTPKQQKKTVNEAGGFVSMDGWLCSKPRPRNENESSSRFGTLGITRKTYTRTTDTHDVGEVSSGRKQETSVSHEEDNSSPYFGTTLGFDILKETSTSRKSSQETSVSYVECPLCEEMFRSSEIQEHAENCLGKPLSPVRDEEPLARESLEECPICNSFFESDIIQNHANSCADSMFGHD